MNQLVVQSQVTVLQVTPVSLSVVVTEPVPNQILVQNLGFAGPPGAQGATGPASGFVYTIPGPVSSLTVTHNLHRFVMVSYVEPNGTTWIPDVQQLDIDTVYLTFPSPVTGKVVCI